jgi:Rrf2 family protein
MKFSSKSEYGVRVMAELARHFGHGPISLTEIAREEDLPLAYLEHIVAPLRKAGLVSSHYGVRGGYELARPPAEITMADVVRVLEGPIAPMICASELPEERRTDYCTREAHCASRILWVRVRDSITSALSAMTVADLVPAAGTPVKVQAYGDMIGLPMIACPDQRAATRVAE